MAGEIDPGYPVIALGTGNGPGLAQTIVAVVMVHAPDFDPATIEMRPSKAGTYLSLTCTIRATSQTQLDTLYRELSGHPMVKVVL